MRKKDLRTIRNELLSAYIELEDIFNRQSNDPGKTEYLEIEMIKVLLNSTKRLEYHCREEFPEMRVKKRWCPEMKKANKLLGTYGKENEISFWTEKMTLSEKFDSKGYLESIKILREIKSEEKTLKRKRI